jgi:uncharacterized protein YbaR (Trm112 family)
VSAIDQRKDLLDGYRCPDCRADLEEDYITVDDEGTHVTYTCRGCGVWFPGRLNRVTGDFYPVDRS